MILGAVSEYQTFVIKSAPPFLRDGVRGKFESEIFRPCFFSLADKPVQFDRSRRCERGFVFLIAYFSAYRSEIRRLFACIRKYFVNNMANARFAVRADDADEFYFRVISDIKPFADNVENAANVIDYYDRRIADFRVFVLGYDYRRAVINRFADKIRAVIFFAFDREKTKSAFNFAGVIGDAGDFFRHYAFCRLDFNAVKKIFRFHFSPCLYAFTLNYTLENISYRRRGDG